MKPAPHPKFAFASFALVALIWGSTWVAIKFSLQGFPPFVGAMLRFVVAIVALVAFAKVKRIALSLPATATRFVIATSLLLYVVDYGLIYWSEQYLNAGVTAIFFAAFPVATALASTFAYKSEALCYKRFVGIFVGLLGLVIVFFDQLFTTAFDDKVMFASAAMVMAAVAAAWSVLMAKKHLMEVETVSLTVHQLLWGVLGLLVLATVRGEFEQIRPTASAVLALVYLGLIGSALAFVLYYRLLRIMSASTLATMTYITPLVAVFSGWLLLGESISLRAVLGGATIFLGITIIQFDRLNGVMQRLVARRPVATHTELR